MGIEQLKIRTLDQTATTGKFVAEPLERGYGATLGNALRRVMLSSVQGAAITYVKIEGVLHEFSVIAGIREDTTELILNLKNVYVQVDPELAMAGEPVTITVDVHSAGAVTGADIQCPAGVEVVNPEVYIASISEENASLQMTMTVEVGKGYVTPDKQERRATQPIGVIPVGSAFTPVRSVNYTVEATRVGFKTDYERLTLDIVTNGTVSPASAIAEASQILQEYFTYFMSFAGTIALPLAKQITGPTIATPDKPIEDLGFSARTQNCLKKQNILTLQDLVDTPEAVLMGIKNFGRKSLLEVRDKLDSMDLTLKGGFTVSTEGVEPDSGGDDE